MKNIIISAVLTVLIIIGAFFYLRTNLGGGGGVDHLLPSTATTTLPTRITLVLGTWGGGNAISGRYKNTALYYHLGGESTYMLAVGGPVNLPKNYQEAMARDKENQYEAMTFIIPAYPKGTEGEIEYYVDTTLDGHLNHMVGIKKIKLVNDGASVSVVTQEITAQGNIIENAKKIDAPSYFTFIESKGSSNAFRKVIYSGDSCRFPNRDAFNLLKGDRVEVHGKNNGDGTMSLCESKDYYVKSIFDTLFNKSTRAQ
jgi:hypothetical protein